MEGWSTLHYTSANFALPIARWDFGIIGSHRENHEPWRILKVPPQGLTSCLLDCPEGGISNVHDCQRGWKRSVADINEVIQGKHSTRPTMWMPSTSWKVDYINRAKARFIGFRQGKHQEIDGEETFSPMETVTWFFHRLSMEHGPPWPDHHFCIQLFPSMIEHGGAPLPKDGELHC